MSQLELPLFEPGPDAEYLTIAEAARRLRCCERTVRRAIDSGSLRAGRIRATRLSRGAIRIRPADLDAWVFGEAPEPVEEGNADG